MHAPRPSPRTAFGWPARLLAVATAAYAIVLVYATHHPRPEEFLGPKPPSDKILHIWAYAVFGGLTAATLAAAGRASLRTWLSAAAALAAFGALDEATQPLPWFRRTADPLDWTFDLLGIALGIGLVAGLRAAVGMLRRGARQ